MKNNQKGLKCLKVWSSESECMQKNTCATDHKTARS